MLHFQKCYPYKVVTLILLVTPILGVAQNATYQGYTHQIIPPSPDAAALAKYGELPVGTYTGIPEINIPIYEIKAGKLSHSISLSYHAGGIKVADISSNVGLGWTLNSGGVITRVIQGIDDEKVSVGFFENNLRADMSGYIVPDKSGISDFDLKRAAEDKLDTQPDLYYFNFGNYSGRFVLDKSGNCYSIPHNKFRIKPGVGPQKQGNSTWIITAEDGTTFTFAEQEIMEVEGGCAKLDSDGPAGVVSSYTNRHISSWYLTEIQGLHPQEKITFHYESLQAYQYDTQNSYSSYYTADDGKGGCDIWLSPEVYVECEPNYRIDCSNISKVQSRALDRITFPGGKVLFEIGTREDLPGSGRVASIMISDSQDKLHKKFILDNDQYFSAECGTRDCKRLKLKAVAEVGVNNTANPPYTFEYNSQQFPSRASYDTDHWGYYNRRSNTTAIAEFMDYLNEVPEWDYLPGANKKPSQLPAQLGTLTKLRYPSGGTVQFDYELNEVVHNKLPNKTLEALIVSVSAANQITPKESETFTIKGYSQNGLFVRASYKTVGCTISDIPSYEDNCPIIEIVGVNGTTFNTALQSGRGESGIVFFLPNGQYELRGSGARSGQSYFMNLSYEPEVNSPNKFAGGLRIRRITESDGRSADSRMIRRFVYEDDNGSSSGRISNIPIYFSSTIQWAEIQGPSGLPYCWMVPTYIRTSENNSTLGTTRGSFVGYGKVIELNGEYGEQGKTEYQYTSVWLSEQQNDSTYIDREVNVIPFGPPRSDEEFKRGFLKKRVDYKYVPERNPQSFVKVKEVINEYAVFGLAQEVWGRKVGIIDEGARCAPSSFPIKFRSTLIRRTGNLSWEKTSVIENYFNEDATQFVSNKSTFSFSPLHRQITQKAKELNEGREEITKYKYPADYNIPVASNDMAAAINSMLAQHVHTNVIEEQTWIRENGNSMLTDAKINIYNTDGKDTHQTLDLTIATPVQGSEYNTSTVDQAGNFVFDSNRFRSMISHAAYDQNTGNILQMTESDGIVKAYLWGYENRFPIAEAINAQLNQIAYTSFENEGGNWNYPSSAAGDAFTGKYHFSGITETSILPAGTYTVAFWALGAGQVKVNDVPIQINGAHTWTRITHKLHLTNAGTIVVNTGSVKIDELRACPVNARMKTYTYSTNASVITSESDHANTTTKYEYDNLHRLVTIRNMNSDITKRYAYHIAPLKSATLPGSNINASFISQGTKIAGDVLTFTALNIQPGATYEWDFGDGMVIRNGTKTISHRYLKNGAYYVKLSVKLNGVGNSALDQIKIALPPSPPSNTTWPAPTIVITKSNRVFLPYPPHYELKATATPSTTGGTPPFQKYIWSIVNEKGELLPITLVGDKERTTTTPGLELVSYASELLQADWIKVRCKIVDANNVVSQVGEK